MKRERRLLYARERNPFCGPMVLMAPKEHDALCQELAELRGFRDELAARPCETPKLREDEYLGTLREDCGTCATCRARASQGRGG